MLVLTPLSIFTSVLIGYVVFKLVQFYRTLSTTSKLIDKLPGMQKRWLVGNLPIGFYGKENRYPTNVGVFNMTNGAALLFASSGIMRYWMIFKPFIMLFSAATVEPLLSSNKAIEKSQDYRFMQPWLGTGLLTSGGTKWKRRRKMLTPSFHFRILDDFQPIIEKHSRVLVEKITELIDKEYVEMVPLLTYCTIDIIFETALGIPMTAQKSNNSPFMIALYEITRLIVDRIMRPWLWNDFIFAITPTGKKFYHCLKEIHALSEMAIRQRKRELLSKRASNELEDDNVPGSKKRAFLDLLLEEHFKDESFTESDIRDEVDTFAFAGHDTTTMGSSWCLFILGHHPEIQDKIHQELLDILGKDFEARIEKEHLKAFKYLECVIKESLRLYPSAPFLFRELQEDLMIGENLIPSGTTCLINISSLHRDSTVFPDPEKFIPERFELEQATGRSPYAYIPFSAGPRNCIGQRFAMNELKTIIANIVRKFRWMSLDHRDKVMVNAEVIGRPYPGHRIKFYHRN